MHKYTSWEYVSWGSVEIWTVGPCTPRIRQPEYIYMYIRTVHIYMYIVMGYSSPIITALPVKYFIVLLRGRIKGTASALSVIQHGLREACAIQHGT